MGREPGVEPASLQRLMDPARQPPRPLLAAAGPASAVVLPPLPVPPPPNTLDTLPGEPETALRASAALAINPLVPPSVPVSQPSPDLPGLVGNSHELVVLLGRSRHLRTKADVVEAESADPAVCEVQLPSDRDLTILGRGPGVTRVMVRFDGDSPRPLALVVRVAPDMDGPRGPTVVQAPRPNVSPQPTVPAQPSVPPQPPVPSRLVLRVLVAELDRTAAKTAGVDADLVSSPATMLLRSLPMAGSGNVAVLKNRLTVCLGARGLQERGALKIFSEPTMAVASGVPAKVVVGGQPLGPMAPGPGGKPPVASQPPLRPTTLNLVATLLAGDRIRLELTADLNPREPGPELVNAGLPRPPAASGEMSNGQTLAVCGLIDAPKKPRPETPTPFPIFGQWFSKPPPPPPNPTEMLILVTAERLNPADAAPADPPSAASGSSDRSVPKGN